MVEHLSGPLQIVDHIHDFLFMIVDAGSCESCLNLISRLHHKVEVLLLLLVRGRFVVVDEQGLDDLSICSLNELAAAHLANRLTIRTEGPGGDSLIALLCLFELVVSLYNHVL